MKWFFFKAASLCQTVGGILWIDGSESNQSDLSEWTVLVYRPFHTGAVASNMKHAFNTFYTIDIIPADSEEMLHIGVKLLFSNSESVGELRKHFAKVLHVSTKAAFHRFIIRWNCIIV